MRKVLIGIVALVVLLMAAALVGPGLVDWNGYRDRIAREAEAATGRKLTIAGDIGLAMLPSPRLRVRDVRLANAPGAAVPDMVTLKALEIDVALWPLLTGAIDVTRVTLVEPVIELQTLPDGSGNWVMKPSAASPPPSAASGIDAAPRPASGGMAIRLEDVGIANGTLVWRDAGGTAERVERIDVKASAESLQGPFRLTGKAVLRGAPVLLDADVGRLDAQAATPLRARVTLEKAKAEATLVATLGPEAPSRRMEGTLKLAADSAAAAAAAILGDAAGLPAAAVAVDAGFLLEGGRVRAEPLTLKLDDTTATGRFEVAPDRNGRNAVALTLRSQRIDVDRLRGLIPARVPAAAPAPAVPPAAGAAPAKAGFTLPGDIAAKVDLTVDTVLARGQTLRNVRVVAQLAQGRLSIDRGGVQLPGPADLSVTGTLAAVQGQPQFDGRVQLTAQNLRTALAAWKAAPDGLPPDRLGRTSFQTRVKASPAQVELQDISLALDAAKATGSAALRLTERPTLTARLAVDRLDLDGYLRKPSGRAAAGAAAAPAVAPPAARGGFDPGVDLDIEVKVGQLVAGGQSARDVVAAGTLQAGTLALRQLSVADYAGASARVQGTVRDLGPGPSVDLVVSAGGRDLGRVIGRGGASAAVQAQQPFAVEGKVAGDAGRLAVDLAARLGDGQAKVTGTLEPMRGLPGMALAIDAAHPSTGRLLSQLAPGYRPQGGDIGPFRLVARTRADGTNLFLDGLSLAAGPARLEGPLRIETAGPRPKLVADLVGSDLVLDAFLPIEERADVPTGIIPVQARPAPAPRPAERWSRAPLDLSALLGNDADVKLRASSLRQGRWTVTRPDIALTLADGTLSLARLNGQVYGGDVAITGQFAAKGTPTGRFELKAQNVDVGRAIDTGKVIRLVGGKARANLTLQTAGRSMYELVAALGGAGDIDVRDGVMRGLNLGAAARAVRSSDVSKLPNILQLAQELGKDGDTQFSSLTGTFRIEKGDIRSDDIRMTSPDFTATATTLTRLLPWTTETRLEAQIPARPDPVPVAMRLEGSMDQPRKIFDTNALQAHLMQRYGGSRLQQIVPGLELPGQRQPQGEDKPQRRNPLDQIAPLLRR